MAWNINNPEGREALKVKYDVVKYTRGKVLDLGCGPWKAFPHFIGMDGMVEWRGQWKPDIMGDCTDLSMFADKGLDAVFSSHLLEHIIDTRKTLMEWWRVIKTGGHLALYLPHKDYYPNIGTPGSNSDHEYDFLPKDIIAHMKFVGNWDLILSEPRNEGQEYSFLQIYKKTSEGHEYSYAKDKPEKTVCVCRYGGFGDTIQTSSILPGLKKQGYHITMMTVASGYELLKHDPNVDDWIIQDKDQVPNDELPQYWAAQEKRFDRFINLSETVEGTFLAIPGRTNHQWPDHIRKEFLNQNYLEFTHKYAQVPLKPQNTFYATNKEVKKALKEKGDKKVILWVLAGSSVHKTWPYLDNAIARILTETDYDIYMVGGTECKLLEQGWEDESRIHRRSGEWSIRETLVFSEICDMVVGPETGIMNGVSLLDMPKILFLSHSSIENLSRDWNNTKSLTPTGCDCYPCHQLHYGVKECTHNKEMGVADCQVKISIEDFWTAFKESEWQHQELTQ